MPSRAAFAAAQPNSSLKAPGVAVPARTTQQSVCPMPASCGVVAAWFRAAVVADWHRRNPKSDRGACLCPPSRIPSSARDHASGLLRRPAARRRSASAPHPPHRERASGTPIRRPFGVSEPPKTSLKSAAENAAQTSSGPRRECTPGRLGAGPTRSLREG